MGWGLLLETLVKHYNTCTTFTVQKKKAVRRWHQLLQALKHLGWTITQWKHVLLSDQLVQMFFLEEMDTVTKDENHHQQEAQKSGSVMVWGCICDADKAHLH